MPYTRHAYVLVFDGFADHETALALHELHESTGYQVIAAGFDRRTITATSGLRVKPDIACEEIQLERAGLFVLPGGGLWEHVDRTRPLDAVTACVNDMLQSCDEALVPVAASGSATLALARAGLLDGVSHTSNGPYYLSEHVREYGHGAFHVDTPAIRDENIITANGTAAVEFAYEIIRQLGLYEDNDQLRWLELHHHARARRPLAKERAA